MKNIFCIVSLFVFLSMCAHSACAAVGCSLNDPDRDVKRIFPESTGYKTTFISIKEKGGEPLKKEIEDIFGEKLEPIYESIDVPYAFYTVLNGKEAIGYIHGVNQKGKYGGLQLIIATDTTGKIINFFYQRISSPEAGTFMDTKFTSLFNGLTLDDFLKNNLTMKDPSAHSPEDFRATLRGLKKNLILLKMLFLKK